MQPATSPLLSNAKGNILSSILAKSLILAGFAVAAKVLGPAQYGVWAMCSLIIYWSTHINLGTHAIMLQEIAARPGNTNRLYTEGVKNKTFTLTLILTGTSLLALYAFFWLFVAPHNSGMRSNLQEVSTIIVLLQIFLFLFSYWSGIHLFTAVSVLRTLHATIACIFILCSVSFWGIQALLWGTLLGYACAIIWTFLKYPFRIRLQIDLAFFRWILKAGFPFLGIEIAGVCLQTMDRAFVYTHLGMQAMGWYSLAYTVSDILCVISFAFMQVLYSRMIAEYRARKNTEQTRQMFLSSLGLCSSGTTLLFVWAWYFAPILIPRLLPQYIAGILPSILLSQASILLSLTVLCGYFLLAVGHPRRYLTILVLGCLLKALLVEAVLRKAGGLTEIALVSLGVYAFLFLMAWHLCDQRRAGTTESQRTQILLPLALCLATAGIYLLDHLPWGVSIAKTGCMILLSSILLWRTLAELKKVDPKANKYNADEAYPQV